MKYRLSKISILQTSKVAAVLYAAFGLIMVPFGCLLLTIGSRDSNFPPFLGVFYLLAPLFYGVIGFISTAIMTWIYNLIAGWLGGIEFTMNQVVTAEQASPQQ